MRAAAPQPRRRRVPRSRRHGRNCARTAWRDRRKVAFCQPPGRCRAATFMARGAHANGNRAQVHRIARANWHGQHQEQVDLAPLLPEERSPSQGPRPEVAVGFGQATAVRSQQAASAHEGRPAFVHGRVMFDGVASHDEILPDFTTPSPFHLFVFASHFACVNKRALSLDLSG